MKRPEIDFLRGSCLMLMVIYHNFRVPTSYDPVQLSMMSWMELGSSIFLLISGVNVSNFIASAAKNPDLDPTRFYFKSSCWLFIMGYSYNFLVGTRLAMDIIQCVAVGTFVTYLLLRHKVSNAFVGFITLLFFVVGIIGFGRTVTLSPVVQDHFLLNQLIGNGTATKEGIASLFPMPWLFKIFGPIPWVGFFTLGIFLDRLRGIWTLFAVFVMIGLAVVGAFLPMLDADDEILLGFRANARYIFQSASLASIWFFLSKAWFRGKTTCNRTVAFWSESSLIVFVFHWIFIVMASTVVSILGVLSRFYFFHDGFRYTRCVLAFSAVALTLGPLEKWRRRLSKNPDFLGHIRISMIVGFILAIFGMITMSRSSANIIIAYGGILLAACSFALSYPSFRARWKSEALRK